MGLLDEAIREHLELKRRRGGDPSEIARQEQAALAPVFPDEPRDAEWTGEAAGPPAGEAILGDEEPVAQSPGAIEAYDELPVEHGEVPIPQPAEETAEFDMRAVLEPESSSGPHGDPLSGAASPRREVPDELLEWETPSERRDAGLQQIPGQEHLAELPEQIPGQERLAFE